MRGVTCDDKFYVISTLSNTLDNINNLNNDVINDNKSKALSLEYLTKSTESLNTSINQLSNSDDSLNESNANLSLSIDKKPLIETLNPQVSFILKKDDSNNEKIKNNQNELNYNNSLYSTIPKAAKISTSTLKLHLIKSQSLSNLKNNRQQSCILLKQYKTNNLATFKNVKGIQKNLHQLKLNFGVPFELFNDINLTNNNRNLKFINDQSNQSNETKFTSDSTKLLLRQKKIVTEV